MLSDERISYNRFVILVLILHSEKERKKENSKIKSIKQDKVLILGVKMNYSQLADLLRHISRLWKYIYG